MASTRVRRCTAPSPAAAGRSREVAASGRAPSPAAAEAREAREGGQRGQASLELVAALPALVLAGLVGLQLLAAGYALVLADGAAEAGTLAVAAGRPADRAAREALPGWARERVAVEVDGGRVTVRLRPPAPLAAVGRALEVRSSAWARPPAETSASRRAGSGPASGALPAPRSLPASDPTTLASRPPGRGAAPG